MNKKAILLLVVLLFSFIPLVSSNTEWFNSSFQYRNVYVIDSSLIDEKLYDFPVLIYLNSSYISWNRVNDNLSDLRFYNVSNNLLSHEIDYFIENDYAYIWVKIPYINNVSDTYFFMYYGCFYAENLENKTNVWSNSYVMVQHMNDNSTSTVLDSTSNDVDGIKFGVNTPIETALGKIGNAQFFDGIGDDIDVVSSDFDFLTAESFTLESWIKTAVGTQQLIYESRTAARPFVIVRVNGNKIQAYVDDTVNTANLESTQSVNDDIFHHVVFVRDIPNDKIYLYIDGSSDATPVADPTGDVGSGKMRLGQHYTTTTVGVQGILDEMRITVGVGVSGVRDSVWVGVSYETQTDNLFTASNFEVIPEEITLRSLVFMALALAVTAIALVIVGWKRDKLTS